MSVTLTTRSFKLTDHMFTFCQKTRRQRINQRNRVERLSPLLDWKNLGIEYSKARQLALRRAYPDSFNDWDDFDLSGGAERLPFSVPGSPRYRTGAVTPGDMGTLTEEVGLALTVLRGCFYAFHRCRGWIRVIIGGASGQDSVKKRKKRGTHCMFPFVLPLFRGAWILSVCLK